MFIDQQEIKAIRLAEQRALEVAKEIEKVCKKKGYTQSKLALKSGVSRNTISKMFSGYSRLSLYTIARICKALDLDFEIKIKYKGGN